MEYSFQSIESKWRDAWQRNKTYQVSNDSEKPKYYVLDMFPYPSGAGLHVGHPLGYIASDIHARYKRLTGFNVLHPMGYDAFGLPAEQYAIETGQHPAKTTATNISRYREQLDKIGFSFDWSREIRTSDPEYYKWTQWIFIKLFNSYYDESEQKSYPISRLIKELQAKGNAHLQATCDEHTPIINGSTWASFNEQEKQDLLAHYRLAYLSEAEVNWCPALGTVLANDEVKEGKSERGGHPVVKKKMTQWSLRITAYAERLLQGLEELDWSDSLKETQRNWIGKSEGSKVTFSIKNHNEEIPVFTTRPDTIYGVSFMVLAPEHALVRDLTTANQEDEIEAYIQATSKRSERERMADVKTISGAFTGSYAIHPLTGAEIPIWISDYVLAGYGTGAVMAVPCGDQRDWNFAQHFNLPIPNVFDGVSVEDQAFESKNVTIANSDFLNGLKGQNAIDKAIKTITEKGFGSRQVNYKLRDAVFGRQRYWGEPIPIYYENGIARPVLEKHLPLNLPSIDKYLPTAEGEPPLARAENWSYTPEDGVVANGKGYPLELTTMPGWAGSSWYYLRYLSPNSPSNFVKAEDLAYWKNVDFYMGGSEHATGHLLYVRFWTKFLSDIGLLPFEEPMKKLVNQGMIQGVSKFVYRIDGTTTFVSSGLKHKYTTTPIHVDVNLVVNDQLDLEGFKSWRSEYNNAEFILEEGVYRCGSEVEKMSKSKYNVVNPDELIEQYGADALRLHEMFLGPIEMHKPWNTQGIDGVSKFLKKLWRLFHHEGALLITEDPATKSELKTLHKTIKKVTEDMDKLSLNTCVSTFMICVNELSDLKCNKREILEPLLILTASHAPFISEELWNKLGNKSSIFNTDFPKYNASFLEESQVTYPISFNGKMRFKLTLSKSLGKEGIEHEVLNHEDSQKWLEGKAPKKIIVVPGKIVNIVV